MPGVAGQPSSPDGFSIDVPPSTLDPTTPEREIPPTNTDLVSPELTGPITITPDVSYDEELLLPQSDEEPLLSHGGIQVEEEIRREYHWLCTLLAENEGRAWGTAYRDFMDVRFLLSAAQGMGMEELRNNRVGNGAFQASTGEFTLSIWDFIDILQLKHSSGTWQNKFTAYFRIKRLCMFAQYKGVETPFQTPEQHGKWFRFGWNIRRL